MTPNQLAYLDEVVGRMTPGNVRLVAIGSEGLILKPDTGSLQNDLRVIGEFPIHRKSDAEGIVALRNSYSQLRDHIKALESKVKELEGKD